MTDETGPTNAPVGDAHPTGRFDARSLYLYLVCLVCAIVVLVATVQLLRAVVELVWSDPQVGLWAPGPDDMPAEQARRIAERSAQRGHALDAVTSIVLLLVTVPAWRFHWGRAQAERRR